ncbi:MAG TPA: hypothetical protein P5080_01500 [Candidatus Paceibacterota bacterium]|nr:hypothetical protein [Candidatus Pacearchaeota archaeon]HRZ50736.1 hypothetical protein [Candidatus Paceibacterota bacterium]HSA36367.1 hypothetical protein [Candidatus Paceibacterota bacterium]
MAISENVLKGKIAENLVEELLKRSGNRVYRLGSDAQLENIVQLEQDFGKDSHIGKKISSIPDFAIIGALGLPQLLEVKFRTDPESLEEELLMDKDPLEKFWEAKIVVVTPKEKPFFRILIPPYFTKEKRDGWPIPVFRWMALEKDRDILVETEILHEFDSLVGKYYSKRG